MSFVVRYPVAALQTTDRWTHVAAGLLCLVSVVVASAQQAAEEEISESDYRRRVVAGEAKSLKVKIGDDEAETTLIEKPVLRWVNPRGGIGGTFLWTGNKLPAALCCIWFAPDKSVHLASSPEISPLKR